MNNKESKNMNKYAIAGIIIFALSIFTIIDVVAVEDTPITIGIDDNISKLDIIPPYANIRLQPGESKEATVTVVNKDNKSILVSPTIRTIPYNIYNLDANWITVSPNDPNGINISAGASTTFTVNVSVPKDATSGSSGVQIAFTNETLSNNYPQPIPDPQPVPSPQPVPVPYSDVSPIYAHVFQLSVDVWRSPNLQISYPYINDQIETGKTYDYEIKVKNIGDSTIGISPKLVNDVFYGPYGLSMPILTEDSINITAPNNISAGATETIHISVKVPVDIVGYYNAYIDLKSDDPFVQEGEGRISLNFNIYKQPTEPFVKNFTMNNISPIKIEVSSYYNKYPYQITPREEPSFDTKVTGPSGDLTLNVTKTVIKGNVIMGVDNPSWLFDNTSIYQDIGSQKIVTYKTDGSPGEWKLNILPSNAQGFDYSIVIGEDI